jgi:hypothetical protein
MTALTVILMTSIDAEGQTEAAIAGGARACLVKETFMEQFHNRIEFRQATYERVFTKARDMQFELVDALLLDRPIRSFPELNPVPTFRRQWHSSYAMIERGDQDWKWLEWHYRNLACLAPFSPFLHLQMV